MLTEWILRRMMTHAVPLRRRPVFGGTAAAIEGVASTSAPLLGGVITDTISWRWCFYINLPLGAITFVLVCLFYQDPVIGPLSSLILQEKVKKLDLLGTAVFVPSITFLLLALQWGGSTYGWGNARIVVLFAVFGLLFVWLQWRAGDDALLPPRIMRQRSILAGIWFVFCNSSSLSVIDF